MSDSLSIEVCVDSVVSAIAAARSGAKRIELCGNLLEGGITPSAGLIQLTRAKTSVGLQVMIRPRGGDFCYTEEEFETMRRDIIAAKTLRANGVVLGILDASGNVDVRRTRELIETARPLNVTFHRAFDMSADLSLSLEDVCDAGADRLLTSGGEQSAEQGVEKIAALAKAARGRIVIMAGGGIRATNAASIIEKTGVKEIHVGLRSPVKSPMLHRNPRISMGSTPGTEYQRFEVSEEEVRNLARAIAAAEISPDGGKIKS
jgi:copper homeostasis protein